ncbi:MAG: hypothetical protein LKJ17_11175 [Oscillospiraceae bacterium]|nr:hypothetical protein [Oscillospiraceae bacterium]
MHKYLIPWFNELKSGGGLSALKRPIGNYNLLYLTLMALGTYLPLSAITVIKGLSILFDYAAATASAYLLYTLMKPNLQTRLLCSITYILTLLSPETILNSAVWGQCDSIYTTFCILALAFLIEQKFRSAFLIFGLAFSFKLQAIFFLPLFIIIWLTSANCKLRYFLLIPATMMATGLPAILIGRPPQDVFGIYGIQIGWMRTMTAGCPNFYSFAPNIEFGYFAPAAILVTLMLLGLMAAWMLYRNRPLTSHEVLLLAVWSSIVCIYFLPDMHERYLFPTDLLLIVLALYTNRYWDRLCALAAIGVSILSYLPYLFLYETIPMWALSLVRLGCVIYLTKQLTRLRTI